MGLNFLLLPSIWWLHDPGLIIFEYGLFITYFLVNNIPAFEMPLPGYLLNVFAATCSLTWKVIEFSPRSCSFFPPTWKNIILGPIFIIFEIHTKSHISFKYKHINIRAKFILFSNSCNKFHLWYADFHKTTFPSYH